MQIRGQEENILAEEISAGQTVGWSALIPPYLFTLTATALLETEVIAVPREALREYFAAYPAAGCKIALNLAVVIGHRLHLSQTMWLRRDAAYRGIAYCLTVRETIDESAQSGSRVAPSAGGAGNER